MEDILFRIETDLNLNFENFEIHFMVLYKYYCLLSGVLDTVNRYIAPDKIALEDINHNFNVEYLFIVVEKQIYNCFGNLVILIHLNNKFMEGIEVSALYT